jgi:LmbE family N-acetylglucosaminyl deacetylase
VIPTPARALVVAAHPDDCEFGCGATVARWARAGAAIHLIVLTDGSKGSHDPHLPDEELRDRREHEAKTAAEVLGLAGVRCARQVDGELAQQPELVTWVAAAIRELRPEVVITHDPWQRYDMHPDHAVAGGVVRAAVYGASEPRALRELAERGLAPWRPEELLLWHPEQPDHFEDAAETFDVKIEALLCHESQYVTSFGIDGAEGGRERFERLVRDRMLGAGPGGGVLAESFRRIPLIRHAR